MLVPMTPPPTITTSAWPGSRVKAVPPLLCHPTRLATVAGDTAGLQAGPPPAGAGYIQDSCQVAAQDQGFGLLAEFLAADRFHGQIRVDVRPVRTVDHAL